MTLSVKVTTSTPRSELNEMAKGLGINWVGVATEALVNEINTKMEDLLNGIHSEEEQQLVVDEVVPETVVEDVVSEEETNNSQEGVDENDAQDEEGRPEDSSTETESQTETRKVGKWFEAEEAVLYQNGDKVEIIEGPLKGRFAIVDKPSAKKDATKAFLINPKTNELQKTNVTLDYNKLKLADQEEELEVV